MSAFKTMTPTNFKDTAIFHTDMGLSVIPVWPNQKVAILKDWPNIASRDPVQILEWSKKYPHANVGVVCGAVNFLTVIDIDVKEGVNGFESISPFIAPKLIEQLYRVSTPSGGIHLYFRAPAQPVKNRVGLLPGVDVRGEHGYVLGAGSIVDGKAYTAVC